MEIPRKIEIGCGDGMKMVITVASIEFVPIDGEKEET